MRKKNKRGSTSFDNREKFGTEFLDTLGDRINETAFGKFRQEGLQKQQNIQQALSEDSSELEKSLLFPEQNQTEANILKGISDATQIDERISTPLTYMALGAGAKGLSKIKPKHLGIKQTIEPYTPPKGLGKTPRKMVNVTNQVEEVFNMRPNKVQEIVRIAKKNKISYTKAEQYVNLKEKGIVPTQTINPGTNAGLIKSGEGPYDPGKDEVYIPPEERPGNEFKAVIPNYKPVPGPDADSGNLPWASTRANISHYDVSNHRIFEVPGMKDETQTKRYKNWITTQLINRYKKQQIDPTLNIKRWSSVHTDFIDNKGNAWRLVKADKKKGVGADQEFIPTPLRDIDSRLMKKKNTSDSEKVILHKLLQTQVKDRNALEKKYPWLRSWISEQTGENYHEHMYGLDEAEFWNSGYGKSLGYMNNDVYDLDKGLGNIVFLQDPRFKKAKDAVADIITPGKKVEIYPGYKRREGAVQTFKAGPYKGLNAIVGYDADPRSRTYTDLTIVAYNPDPNEVFAERVTTIPNYYSLVFAKSKGRRLIDDTTAKGFLRQYVEAVLNNDQPKIILLTDFAEALPKLYPELLQPGFREIPPGDFEIPEPSGLNLDPEFRSVGKYSKKDPDPDPLQQKVFKMDNALQRKRDAYMKRLLIKLKKGTYTQLDFINLLFYRDP